MLLASYDVILSLFPKDGCYPVFIPERRTHQIIDMSCGISLAEDVLSCLTAEEQISCSEFRADFQFCLKQIEKLKAKE